MKFLSAKCESCYPFRMALFLRCNQCSREASVASFGGGFLPPRGWVVDGAKHYCNERCRKLCERAAQPRKSAVVTTARDIEQRCRCVCEYGDHSSRAPHRCLVPGCDCAAFDDSPLRQHLRVRIEERLKETEKPPPIGGVHELRQPDVSGQSQG